jgi:hypothetical protein
MKKAARVHWMILLAPLALIVVLGLLMFSEESPEAVTNKFMIALAKADTKKLAELSFIEGNDNPTLEKKWDKTVNKVAKHFIFNWRVVASSMATPERASVDLQFTKNLDNPASYEEKFGIPLEKIDGKWRVMVGELDREMFPGLPR